MAFSKGQKVQTTVKVNARYTPGGKFRAVVRVGYPITITDTRMVGKVQHIKGAEYWYATKDENGKVLIKLRAPAGGGGSGTVGKVKSPVPGKGISTPWGKKPNDNTYWQSRGHHTGDDYAAPAGADVVAVRAGTIRWHDEGVLGKCLLLLADNGRTYWYCHLSNRRVKNGAKVKAGQHIGDVGQTGTGARGNHLHFEMRSGHTTSWSGTDKKPSW